MFEYCRTKSVKIDQSEDQSVKIDQSEERPFSNGLPTGVLSPRSSRRVVFLFGKTMLQSSANENAACLKLKNVHNFLI